MSYDNSSGVVLDHDWERMYDVKLPLVKVNRVVSYKGKEVESREDSYGEMMFMGDIHIGHEAHSHNPFNAYVNFLKERPHIRVGLMGDYLEYAEKTNFVKNEVMGIDEQIDLFIRYMKPLRDRIDFILWGNHEERFAVYTKSNRLMQGIANEIGVGKNCYVGEPQRGVYLIVKSGKKKYGTYAHHSKTGAVVNKTFQLRRTGNNIRAALIVHGHTHHLGYEQQTVREITPSGRITRRQWLVSSGCFIKDASYAEARSYPLNVVGAPIIRFYSDRNKLDFVDISTDYREYITRGGIPFAGDMTGVTDMGNVYQRRDRVVLKPVLSPSGGVAPVRGRGDNLSPL